MLLDTGVYLLKTESLRMSPIDYIHEWFDNVTDPAKATPVAVRAGSTFEANFGLSKLVPPTYATIEGYVTDTLGNPLRRATVAIMHPLQVLDAVNAASLTTPGTGDESMDVEGVGYCRGVVWKGYTDSLGFYKARVISDRAYIAMAAKWGYRAEYYDNKPNPLLADIIKVPTNIKSINFELASNPVVHNSISGVVRDSLGNEVVSRIVLFPADPTAVRMPIRFGHTDSTGAYTIGDVRLGTYIVLAVPFGKYAPAFYKKGAFGVIYWKMADRVLVSGDVNKVSISMCCADQLFGYATLSGIVTAGTAPLAGVRVMATSASGAVVGSDSLTGPVRISIAAVPPGPTTITVDCPDLPPLTGGHCAAGWLLSEQCELHTATGCDHRRVRHDTGAGDVRPEPELSEPVQSQHHDHLRHAGCRICHPDRVQHAGAGNPDAAEWQRCCRTDNYCLERSRSRRSGCREWSIFLPTDRFRCEWKDALSVSSEDDADAMIERQG